nr:Gag-protease polyprotein [Tanacetum cinerariifolium]
MTYPGADKQGVNGSGVIKQSTGCGLVWGFGASLYLKVTTIEEAKDLAELLLDELIGNLKVYEMVLGNDDEVSKNKGHDRGLTLDQGDLIVEFRRFEPSLRGLNRKPKRIKDYAYHKDKMMLCKQEKKGVLLSVEQGDWLDDIDEELNEHELEAHYTYMAKIQEVLTADSEPNFNAEPLEKVHQDDEYNMFANKHEHTE